MSPFLNCDTSTYATAPCTRYHILEHYNSKACIILQNVAVGGSLESDNANMRISVKDDGIGFDPSVQFLGYKDRLYGLFSIRERLDKLGGHLEIMSQPNRGTCVTLVAPHNNKT